MNGATLNSNLSAEEGIVSSLIKSLTSATGQGLTVGGSAGAPTNGEIDIEISASDTASFSAPITGVYDLEVVSSGGIVDRVLEKTI